jgi:nucleoside-diphosphate-sugar epimerase
MDKPDFSKVLVTGSEGFIGKNLCELMPGCVRLDLKLGQDVREKLPDEDFTHVFHLAALKSVPKGEKESKEFITTNCWGTRNVVQSYPNAQIIYASSGSVNDIKSVYGATKFFGEMMASFHMSCISARLYNVFGEHQHPESGAVVPRFIEALLNGTKPMIRGSGEQLRDFTYVKDVAQELFDIMFSPFKISGVTHIGYGEPISVNHLLKLIYRQMPEEIDYEPMGLYEIQDNRAPYSIEPKYGLEEGLKKTIEWARRGYPEA